MIFDKALVALLGVVAPAMAAGPSPFEYDPVSPKGPAHWASLDIPNNACGGSKNSPIDVQTRDCDVLADYKLNPGTCTFENVRFSINDHGVKASYPEADTECEKNTVVIPGLDGTFKALQFHIHMSSEHSMDGRFFGAELHIVHKHTTEDRYAVVGMVIEATNTDNNKEFEELLHHWDIVAENTLELCSVALEATRGGSRQLQPQHNMFNVYNLVPEGTAYYNYDGGLTTPPCSEVVEWNLADTPLSISPSQYSRLSQLILGFRDPDDCERGTVASPSGSTSRPPQPLNGRVVKRVCPAGGAPVVGQGESAGSPVHYPGLAAAALIAVAGFVFF